MKVSKSIRSLYIIIEHDGSRTWLKWRKVGLERYIGWLNTHIAYKDRSINMFGTWIASVCRLIYILRKNWWKRIAICIRQTGKIFRGCVRKLWGTRGKTIWSAAGDWLTRDPQEGIYRERMATTAWWGKEMDRKWVNEYCCRSCHRRILLG